MPNKPPIASLEGKRGGGVGGGTPLGLTHISHQSSMLCVPRNGSLGPKKGIL